MKFILTQVKHLNIYIQTPKNEHYLKYQIELEQLNNDIIEFKQKYQDLSNLEINEIYDEMLEHKQWRNLKLN